MRRPPRWLGPMSLAALCLGPLVPWSQTDPLFSPVSVGLRSVAVAVALVGIAAFAANFVLAARLRPVEWLFGGLDRLYRIHRRVGATATLLLVAHGVLVVASLRAPNLGSAVQLVFIGQGWRVSLGIVAAGLLAGAVLVSFYAPIAHPTFVLVQRTMGPIFAVGAAHALLVPSARAMSGALTGYLYVLVGAGAAAYVYRSLLGRVLVPRYRYRVEAVNRLDADTAEVVFRPLDERMRFRPGQFVFVTLLADRYREPHPFSIASGPNEDTLRVVVKALGDYTQALQQLPAGGDALIEGPYGGFAPLASSNPRQVWVAGGIGVTPFLSAARAIEGTERDVDLYYCTDRADQAHFIDELFAIADRNPRLRVIPIRKTDLGYITAADIDGASHVVARSELFVCGPPVMMRTLHRQLRALGMDRKRIHFEDFSFA